MDSTLILVKTSKGVEEIKSRSSGLSQNLRALLIMADGATSLSGLLGRTNQKQQAEEGIAWLVREGLTAEEALRRVRLIDAQYVQSEAQEALLYEFENALLQKMA